MTTLQTMDSSILSFVILILIYINAYSRLEQILVQYKLFIVLIQTNMLLIIVDILSWIFNGLPGYSNMLYNKVFCLTLYVIEPIGPMLWILYTNFQVFHDEDRLRNKKKTLLFLLGINALISIVSLHTGWFFSVDANNIYHRGEFYWIHATFCYALLAYSLVFIIKKRRMIEKKYYYSLVLFYLPQLIGTTIQILYYGVSYCWSGMMLSLLIVYFNIQDRGLSIDYLTGVYNRRQLDTYLNAKIRKSMSGKSFSAILIDINKFKQINDEFGHDIGDEALKDAVKILKQCLSHNDFIARFGGDEFFVILENDNYQVLEQTVNNIVETSVAFNRDSQKPYNISFSMGFAVYDHKSKMTPDDFFKHIDILMYNNKKIPSYVGR